MSAGRSRFGLRFDWIGLLFACLLTLFIALPL
ncbi:ABC transporter permease, partial [Rhizobium ruizarguesonis]